MLIFAPIFKPVTYEVTDLQSSAYTYHRAFYKIENLFICFINFLTPERFEIRLGHCNGRMSLLFVFAANVMGELGAFYEKIPIWDSLLHAVNGFICAGVGFGLTDILNRSERVKLSLSPMFVCLFSFCFSMTVGVVWEFFEFGADMLFEKDMQKDTVITAIHSGLISGKPNVIMHIRDITSTVVNGENLGINGYLDIGLIDTMKDLLVNFVGAVVFDTIGWFYLKGRSAGFLRNFIPVKK